MLRIGRCSAIAPGVAAYAAVINRLALRRAARHEARREHDEAGHDQAQHDQQAPRGAAAAGIAVIGGKGSSLRADGAVAHGRCRGGQQRAQFFHRIGLGERQAGRQFFSRGQFRLGGSELALLSQQFGFHEVGLAAVGVVAQDLVHHGLRLGELASFGGQVHLVHAGVLRGKDRRAQCQGAGQQGNSYK